MKATITGASGYIGGHLVRALVRRGDEVTCLVRPTSRTSPLESQPVALVTGDLRDPASLPAAVRGADVVFHLAALISAADGTAFESANVGGTRNLVEACLEAAPGLRRFVFVSSIAAAGPSPDGRVLDEDDEPRPVSDYGRSKLAGERLVRDAGDRLPATIIRPPNVLGPGQPELEAAAGLMRWRLAPSLGDGGARTSLIDVEDLVRALILAAEHPRTVGRTYFVTDGRRYSWREVTRTVREEIGLRGPVLPVAYPVQLAAAWLSETAARLGGRPPRLTREIVRAGHRHAWLYDGSRFERELGFRPEKTMRDSVRQAVGTVARRGRRRTGKDGRA